MRHFMRHFMRRANVARSIQRLKRFFVSIRPNEAAPY